MTRQGSRGRPAFAVDTPRLRLRELEATDERLYCELYTDPVTMRFIGAPLSPQRAAGTFRAALVGMCRDPIESLFLTVVEKAARETIGICSIQRFDVRRRRAEAGIILRSGVHSRGYAKESFAALLKRAFELFPVEEIRVEFSVDHLAAGRVAASLGFSRCDDVAADDARPGNRIWSARRESWC